MSAAQNGSGESEYCKPCGDVRDGDDGRGDDLSQARVP